MILRLCLIRQRNICLCLTKHSFFHSNITQNPRHCNFSIGFIHGEIVAFFKFMFETQ